MLGRSTALLAAIVAIGFSFEPPRGLDSTARGCCTATSDVVQHLAEDRDDQPQSADWHCDRLNATSVMCEFTRTQGAGNMCVDVVATCSGRDVVETLCSGVLSAPGRRTVIARFPPPVDLEVACSLSYQHARLR